MIVTNCQIFSQLFVFPALMHNPQLDLFNAEAEEDVINDQSSLPAVGENYMWGGRENSRGVQKSAATQVYLQLTHTAM